MTKIPEIQVSVFKSRTVRLLLGLVSLTLIAAAWLGLAGQNRDLTVRHLRREGVPLRFVAPEGADGLPSVIVAHGFSVSQQIMLGYANALASAGYGAMLFDFAGHGSNENPLVEDGDPLQESLEVAYRALIDQPEVNPEQIALLGQSMGSGAVMQAGYDHPERYKAVVAVSPTDADVDEGAPPNLLLQAGRFERPFVANAKDLLARAGGENLDFSQGQARRFIEIPNVEHVTILFSAKSQELAVDWLNRSFDLDSNNSYTDRRMLWYALHLIGWLGLGITLAPIVPKMAVETKRSLRRSLLGLVLASILATLLLALIASVVEIDELLGMLVSGSLAIWLVLMGGVWLLVGLRLSRPRWASLIWGLIFFGLIWLTFGLMAQFTWINWFLPPARLARWPVLALACLPWKLAAGYAANNGRIWERVGWWLAQSVIITGGLIATSLLVPNTFVLLLMAPVLPLVLALESFVGAIFDDPWFYALGSALFFGWIIAALFPLV